MMMTTKTAQKMFPFLVFHAPREGREKKKQKKDAHRHTHPEEEEEGSSCRYQWGEPEKVLFLAQLCVKDLRFSFSPPMKKKSRDCDIVVFVR